MSFRAEFDAKPQGFSPLYLETPPGTSVSTNAGDVDLYVGGGSINAAFARVLSSTKPQAQSIADYRTLHYTLLESEKAISDTERETAAAIRRCSVWCEDEKPIVVLPKFLKHVSLTRRSKGSTEGLVCLTTFEEDYRPGKKNIGMLYVVGPKGKNYSRKAAFLDVVKEVSVLMARIVATYNADVASSHRKHEPIEFVRVCLVSGGVYKHKDASKVDVAKAILGGLREEDKEGCCVWQFAYDDNVFRIAHDDVA